MNSLNNWQKKLPPFLAKLWQAVFFFIKKQLRKKGRNTNNYPSTDQLDRKLVFNLSKKTLPSFSQLKLLSRFLSKKEKRVIKVLLLIIVICLVLLGGDFYFRHIQIVPAFGGTYIEGLVGVPNYINPILASYNDVDRDLTSLIFNGLLRVNSEGVLENDLAESFQISPDRKIYTLKIRDGVFWHDGKPLTVDDVIFTVTCIQDPEWQSQLKSVLGNVQVEKLDEQTLRFVLKEPLGNFLSSLTFCILPQHKWQAIPASNATLAELNKKPVGTGPFQFASLTKDKNGNIRTYTLKRNDNYFEKLPFLKELIFKFYGDFETATDALANKNIQGLSLLPKEYQSKVEKNKDLRLYSLSLPQYTAVFFNTKKNEAIKDPKIRQALAYAVNRQLILQESVDQKGVIINGPILPGFIGYHPDIKKYPYEPDTAAKLLDEVGWKIATTTDEAGNKIRKKGDQSLQITLTTVEKIEYTKAVEIIKANWEAIGINTNIEIIAKDRIRPDIIEPRNYQALLFGEIIKSDPYPFWHSSQTESPGTNLAVWANREVDKDLEEARTMEDAEAINKKYIHFQDILAQYVPAIFLYNPIHTYPVDSNIKGIITTTITVPSDRFNRITDWYIKTKRQFSW